MKKKLQKDFNKNLVKNRDPSQGNELESKLVHSDDYKGKLIKSKDKFQDKIIHKDSKLIHEGTVKQDKKSKKQKDYQRSKNKEIIREQVSDEKRIVQDEAGDVYQYRDDYFPDKPIRVEEDLVSKATQNLSTEDVSANVEFADKTSLLKSDRKLEHSKDYGDKLIHTKDRFQEKIQDKESKLTHEGEVKEDRPATTRQKNYQRSKNKELIREKVSEKKSLISDESRDAHQFQDDYLPEKPMSVEEDLASKATPKLSTDDVSSNIELGDKTSLLKADRKLEHSKDYRDKIIHTKDRFQDKVLDKDSKLTHEGEVKEDRPATTRQKNYQRSKNKEFIREKVTDEKNPISDEIVETSQIIGEEDSVLEESVVVEENSISKATQNLSTEDVSGNVEFADKTSLLRVDRKLEHSKDYGDKIIHTKDRFQDKVLDKDSKLTHEGVVKEDSPATTRQKNYQRSKNKEIIRGKVSDEKSLIPDESRDAHQIQDDYLPEKPMSVEEDLASKATQNLSTEDVSSNAEFDDKTSLLRTDRKLEHSKDYGDKLTHTKDRFQDKILDKDSKLVHKGEVKETKTSTLKEKDYQRSKNKRLIREKFTDEQSLIPEEIVETNLVAGDYSPEEPIVVEDNTVSKATSKLNTADVSRNVELADKTSLLKTDRKPEDFKDYGDKIIHSKDRFQDKIQRKKSKLVHRDEGQAIVQPKSKRHSFKYQPVSDEVSTGDKVDVESRISKSEPTPESLEVKEDFKAHKKKHQQNRYKETNKAKEEKFANQPEGKLGHEPDKGVDSPSKQLKEEQKTINKKKTYYKRKNYIDDTFTRKKAEKIDGNAKKVTDKKDFLSDKKIEKLEGKKKKLLEKNLAEKTGKGGLSVGLLKSGAKSSELVRDYLDQGSEDNVGVQSAETVAHVSSKLQHGARTYKLRREKLANRKLTKIDHEIKKRKSKLEFKSGLEELRKDEGYRKSSRYKKFYQRQRMKNQIAKKHKTRLVDRIKKTFIGLAKKTQEYIARKGKTVLFFVLGIGLMVSLMIGGGGMALSGVTNATSTLMTTTYLSEGSVLSEVNQDFSALEYGLQAQIESVETNYPGYDEYIINKDGEIGHNVHELLSYLTSRQGEIKNPSDVQALIKDLFDRMYRLTFDEVVEIRTRTVAKTAYDDEGNPYTVYVKENYEYKKLIVNLKKREMDTVIREILADYPDNIAHYEALLASQGNMADIFGSGSGDLSEIINNPNFGNPGLAFDDETTKKLFNEADKHVGKRYVFGANGPDNFDCSSFVCWTFTKSGVKNMPRTTAWLIYKNYCNPISPSEAQAGDIIFFHSTYNSGTPISHVGIYAGNGMMVHAGDPIQYTSINSKYWTSHFYAFGRPK